MELDNLKTGCNLNNVCINHFMYADDTVLVAPSPVALQRLINCCYEFALDNDIQFNKTKTVCMYIKSKHYKNLAVPNFYLNGDVIAYVEQEKYLGVIMNNICKHDADMYKQVRSLYCRGNMLINNFKTCNNMIKLQLFKSFCTNMYCGQLWYNYSSHAISKIKVAYKQTYRRLLNLSRINTSITMSMVRNNIDPFDVILRKSVYSFRCRVQTTNNCIVRTIANSLYFIQSAINVNWMSIIFRHS